MVDYDPTGVYEELKPISTNPCGELGLGAYDSCRLILTNLTSLVANRFEKDAHINEELAYQIFYETQVLADNLVELEIEAVDRILTKLNPDYHPSRAKEWVDKQTDEFKLWRNIRTIGAAGRRTGTGITAYGDMLAMLLLPFGNIEATEKIFKLKLQAELDATIDLAIIRGAFPLWDPLKEFRINSENTDVLKNISINTLMEYELSGKNDWFNFILREFPEQARRMFIYGRRNSGISTIAPAGTVSIMTRTTSGIEPLFMPYYTRRKKCVPGEKHDFIDVDGEKYVNFNMVHPLLEEWIAKQKGIEYTGTLNLSLEELKDYYEKSPWYKQKASDLDLTVRVDTQALIQKYITSSISSTVNLPSTISKDALSEAYLYAIEKGCKGMTFYRDGTRGGILVESETKKETSEPKLSYKKRPRELKADLHVTRSKGNYYAVIIGLMDDKPYEVFVMNTYKDSLFDTSGKVVKVKRGHYKFISDNLTIENISESGNNQLEKAIAVFSSMSLRHGADIHYVIKTAKKLDDGITSFVAVMNRVLAKYDNITTISKCPECGGKLVYEGGCDMCKDCGYSKCG